MSTNGKDSGKNGQKLDDIVQDADDYYNYLKEKHRHETRLDVIVVSLIVWFASFAVIGLSAFALYGARIEYVLLSFLIAIVIGAASGIATYMFRRRRSSKFTDLGSLLSKMKQGTASSEDGLHLMDAMHQAGLASRKRRLDSAFEYGVLAFALVSIIGMNAAIGALAGIIVYLYFRFEALRDYERGEERYENSKRELLQSL